MTLSTRFVEISSHVRNWGRWGDDDELGTLNLITPGVVQGAAACIHTGETFPLSVPLEADGIQVGFIPGRDNPTHTMISLNEALGPDSHADAFHTSDDAVQMGLQAATHWDGLCHVSYGGFVYNGYSADSVTAEGGATLCLSLIHI